MPRRPLISSTVPWRLDDRREGVAGAGGPQARAARERAAHLVDDLGLARRSGDARRARLVAGPVRPGHAPGLCHDDRERLLDDRGHVVRAREERRMAGVDPADGAGCARHALLRRRRNRVVALADDIGRRGRAARRPRAAPA